MKKRILLALATGLALSFLLIRLFPAERAPRFAPEAASKGVIEVPVVESDPRRVAQIVPGVTFARTAALRRDPAFTHVPMAERPQTLVAPEKHLQKLILSEESVDEMERSFDALRDNAYTESVSDGWRVRILHKTPGLSSTGLQDGDVITYDSLRSEADKADRAELAARFADLLGRIER